MTPGSRKTKSDPLARRTCHFDEHDYDSAFRSTVSTAPSPAPVPPFPGLADPRGLQAVLDAMKHQHTCLEALVDEVKGLRGSLAQVERKQKIIVAHVGIFHYMHVAALLFGVCWWVWRISA